jgi:hypothetical protein
MESRMENTSSPHGHQINSYGLRGMLKKIGIVSALCLFVAGCSTLKIAYGFLDTAVLNWAGKYLDIGEDNERTLDAEISQLVTWHRTQMLPKYAGFFESQAQLAEGAGWTRADVDEAVGTFREIIKETSQGAAPYSARVLAGHTSEPKANYIQEAMGRVVSERRERFKEPLADQIDRAVDKSIANYERFFGTLTDDQIAIVRKHKTKTYDPKGEWLNLREKRQQDFIRFLRTEPSTFYIENYVKVALTKPEKIVGEAYREGADRWWAKQAVLLYDLVTTLDNSQRQTLANNLRGYAVDMVELAKTS